MSTKPQRAPEDKTEELPEVGAYGRVWQRWNASGGSSQLSLKAMAVLYDAGHPLTLDELVEHLLPQLDTYARSYLEAWCLRRTDQLRKANRTSVDRNARSMTPEHALRRWLVDVFVKRAAQGHTLRREGRRSGSRFSPGPRAPRAQRNDGTIVRFTPEHRQEMAQQEQADRVTGWQQAMQMEWQRIRPQLEAITDDHSRLLVVAFLARRFSGLTKSGRQRTRLSETTLRSVCHHLLSTENPAVKQAILKEILAWAFSPSRSHERDEGLTT